MVMRARFLKTFAHEFLHIDDIFELVTTVPKLGGLQYLLHGLQQAVRIGEHDAVKLIPLFLVDFAALQRLKVKANGSQGSLQFMSDSMQKAVLLFVSANLPNQEDRVQH